jgi:hypothetical protein
MTWFVDRSGIQHFCLVDGLQFLFYVLMMMLMFNPLCLAQGSARRWAESRR